MATGNTYAIPTWSEVTGHTNQIENKINEMYNILEYFFTTGGTYSGYIYPGNPTSDAVPTGGTFTISYTINKDTETTYSITINQLEFANFNWDNQQNYPFYFVTEKHFFSENYTGKQSLLLFDLGTDGLQSATPCEIYCKNTTSIGLLFRVENFIENHPNGHGDYVLNMMDPITIKLDSYVG